MLENIRFISVEQGTAPRYRVAATYLGENRQCLLTLDESAALRIMNTEERHALAERKLLSEEEINELLVKDSDKAFELKSKINRLKKTQIKHEKALALIPDTVGNSEKRIDLGMKIDGLKRNIRKHTEAHKKLAPAEYQNEEVEQIDELKSGTLTRYAVSALTQAKKAQKSADANKASYGKEDWATKSFQSLADKRNAGATAAIKKLAKGDFQNESVEDSINPLSAILKSAFASEYAFYLKAHFAHWNVEGPDFSEFHDLFGKIYEEVYGILDDFAENIRKCGDYAPGSFESFLKLSKINSFNDVKTAEEFASELLSDSDKLSNIFGMVYRVADAQGEFGLANFLADRQDAQRKHSWMLKSTLKSVGFVGPLLAKEEVEELDELDVKTIRSYHTKAKADIKNLRRVKNDQDRYAAMYRLSSNDKEYYPSHSELDKKIDNRSTGIKQAAKRMKKADADAEKARQAKLIYTTDKNIGDHVEDPETGRKGIVSRKNSGNYKDYVDVDWSGPKGGRSTHHQHSLKHINEDYTTGLMKFKTFIKQNNNEK